MRLKIKHIYFLALVLFIYSCTEKFYPEIDENVSILVVDGKITNARGPYEVRLFRTVKLTQLDSINPEEEAIVTIYDDKGNTDSFIEISPGIYNNLTPEFRGIVGRSYWIEIQTSDGKKYESTPEVIPPEIEIENIYGEDTKVLQDNGEFLNGAGFYLDAKSPSNQSNYLRWVYKESWEWRNPFYIPKTNNPSKICYPYNISNNVSVYDGSKLNNKEFKHLSTSFINTNEVKLNYNYFLSVSLYSINFKNYKFWKNIQKSVQNNGGIYDVIPSYTDGNICACEDDDSVIGYFEASSVSTRHQTFTTDDFEQDFSDFPRECNTKILELTVGESVPRKYHIIKTESVEQIMIYTVRLNYCYDCNVEYSPLKPSFWP